MKATTKKKKAPVEPHLTAAWANIEQQEPKSQVPIPSQFEVENAKEWVDTTQK